MTPQQPNLSRLLFCTDFSENAMTAFRHAVHIAENTPGCRITLLHVLPEIDAQFWKTYMKDFSETGTDPAHTELMDLIDRTYRPLLSETIPLHTVFRTGKPAAQIIRFAQEDRTSLIVIGRRGAGLRTLLAGSTAAKVVQSAPCGVLVIPASDPVVP